MADTLDAERLRKLTDDIIKAITSPPFVEAMRKMKATPVDQRLKVAPQLLSPEVLRSQGAPLPVDMRITSRYFETGKPTIEVTDPAKPGQPPIVKEAAALTSLEAGPVTAGACACGGAGTVCGGAGS